MSKPNFDEWSRKLDLAYRRFEPGAKPGKSEKFFREMELDCSRAQAESRTVEATLSTTNPVFRGGYREILSHEDGAVDLSRAAGGLPLLWSHNQEQLIGTAENVRIYQGRLRARLKFSESKRGEEVWQDVLAGHVRGISIGYQIEDYTEVDGDDRRSVLTATRWTPFEASCVAVPADIGAGIGRSVSDLMTRDLSPELSAGQLRESPKSLEVLDRQFACRNFYLGGVGMTAENPLPDDELKAFQQRIMSVSSEYEADKLHDDMSKAFMERIGEANAAAKSPSTYAEAPAFISQRDHFMNTEFSLCRALSLTFDPQAAREGGPELELMQDAARLRGKKLGERFTLPDDCLFRSVTKGGSGANLIGVGHMGGMFIPALRERLVTGRAGATILTGLTQDIQIPKSTTDASAGWIAGDGSDAVSSSDPVYGKLSLSPTTLGCYTTISRKALLQGDPATETLVRNSLAFAVAKALDSAALVGDGTSNVPTGILNTADIGTDTYTTAPTFGEIVDMEGALMVDDADAGALSYVTTGALAATLKQTDRGTDTGAYIWTSTDAGEGRMNGYRALVSNVTPAGYVIFGNWSDLIIALWSGLDFTVDPYTRASYGDVIVTVLQDCDVAVRHGESFAEIHSA